MFTTQDEWIKSISDAYENPEKFLVGKSMWSFQRNNLEAALRACLCSEKLDRGSLLLILGYIPRLSLRRSIKNKEVRNKIRSLILSKNFTDSSFDSQSITSIVTLFLEDVIDEDEASSLINKYPAFQTYWKKPVIVNALSKTFKNYEKVQNADVFERQKVFNLGLTIIKSKRGFTSRHLISSGAFVYEKKEVNKPSYKGQKYMHIIDYVASANKELAYLKFILDIINLSIALQKHSNEPVHKFFKTNLKNRTDGILIPKVKDAGISFFSFALFEQIKDENVAREMITNLYNFIKDNNYDYIIDASLLFNVSFNAAYIDQINKLNLPQEVNKYFAQKLSI
jgi:hypothetical protein